MVGAIATLKRLGAPALLAVLVLAGCSSGGSEEAATTAPGTDTGPRVVQPGAPGEDVQEVPPEELENPEVPAHTPADVEFMQMMTVHHRQALRMTALVPERAARRNIPLFAERLEISQEDELLRMEAWLEARGEEIPPPEGDAAHAGHLPGMLTEAELTRLEASRGREFDRRFLRAMIRHHEGAIEMVTALQETPDAGQEPEISVFAGHVVADQTIEIRRMQELLADMNR